MLSCKKTTELASNRLDGPINGWQKIGMGFHLLLCLNCRRYFKQLKFLQRVFTNADKQALGPALSDEARQRIRQKLQDAGKQAD